MTHPSDMKMLTDEQKFDLLEHPELWPEDPEVQAELAEMLELHLAFRAHGEELDAVLQPRRAWWRSSGMAAAAATLLAVVPTVYAVQHSRAQAEQRRNADHIQAVADQRGQEKLWMTFLADSTDLVAQFEKAPSVCGLDKSHEDRNRERGRALALLECSRMLDRTSGNKDLESIRASLQDWFRELSLEDGCLSPERADQLRSLAKAHDLAGQAERMRRILAGGES